MEVTAAIIHLEDPQYNDMMSTIEENGKMNKPVLSIEEPEGSSGTIQEALQ